MAGPLAQTRVPRNRATVILAIDVSLSMRATDVPPSRLAAAQAGAKTFADNLTPGINLGLEAFAGTASMLVLPITDHAATDNALDHLQLAERTATGEAIFTALHAIDTLAGVLGGGSTPPPASRRSTTSPSPPSLSAPLPARSTSTEATSPSPSTTSLCGESRTCPVARSSPQPARTSFKPATRICNNRSATKPTSPTPADHG